MHVYHKYYPDQNLCRPFVLIEGEECVEEGKRFVGDGSTPEMPRRECKCLGTIAKCGGGLCTYQVCLKCGVEQ